MHWAGRAASGETLAAAGADIMGVNEASAAPQQRPGMKGAPLRGMFSRQLKRHPGLIPLIGFIGLGLGSAALYLLRLALYSPDVSWDRKNNPEPWNNLRPNDQYKFMAVSTDYKSLKKDRPDF